jgi:hypothetical protein
MALIGILTHKGKSSLREKLALSLSRGHFDDYIAAMQQ